MSATRLLLIGHGRMGRLVEALAGLHGCEVVGIIDRAQPASAFDVGADVAIDFSIASAVPDHVAHLAAARTNVVIGATGWQAEEPALRALVARAGVGVLASANFAVGMAIVRRLVHEAASLAATQPDIGAWIHEAHHAAKKDAPSGTALMIERAMTAAGYARRIDVSSTRAGSLPGTHTVGFDSPSETITITHTVRDRSVFAHGALQAARWLVGRQGWHVIDDVLTSPADGARR